MDSNTILYITLAAITALLLALFQYLYKSKLKPTLRYTLTALRFITLFSILFLLINPKFESLSYFNEKPTLVIAADNSESISYLQQKQNANQALQSLKRNSDLNEKFKIETYSFGKTVGNLDSLNYKERQSDISEALNQFGEVYSNQTAPIILLTDGNQTYGSDYSFIFKKVNQPIYPIILGDSTVYSDVSIKQLNVNRYVYLKNKFPVEIITNYNGTESVRTELKILTGNSVVFRKQLEFNATKASEIISTSLLANSVGIKSYRVELTALNNEKNKVNNIKNFAVEVIDQKTNIALVSDRLHPDLGTLKKAIESNEQRHVSILKPQESISQINDFQLIILYQPNNRFNEVLKEISAQKLNTFTISGLTTNWGIINNNQEYFNQKITNQTETYQPILNRNFGTFIVDNLNFNEYPPLKSEFGKLTINVPHEVLLYKSVNNINTNELMLATFEANNTKHAVLNGEGIWRWRAQAYLDSGSFMEFDNFMGKLIQYLSSNKKRKRLNLDYKTFYNGNDNVIVKAQYFNKNFEFDDSASLTILLKNKDNESVREIPLLLNNTNYIVDLSGIDAGEYDFTIKHNSESVSASGNFKILEYNVEQQFSNADISKLNALAENSEAQSFYSTQTNALISTLLNDNRYATIQKSTKNIVPLIDWKYLLGIIALSLFAEWFIRKYNGLI